MTQTDITALPGLVGSMRSVKNGVLTTLRVGFVKKKSSVLLSKLSCIPWQSSLMLNSFVRLDRPCNSLAS